MNLRTFHDSFYTDHLLDQDEEGNTFAKIAPLWPKTRKDLKILDLGCGAGSVSASLVKHGHTVYGLDIQSEAVKRAKKKGLKARVFDLNQSLPYPDNFFDIVIATDILEHLLLPLSMLQEIHRVLKRDAFAITMLPLHFDLIQRIRMLLGRGIVLYEHLRYSSHFKSWDYIHTRFFTLKEVYEFIRLGQFKIEKRVFRPLAFDYPSIVLNKLLRKFFNQNTADRFPTLCASGINMRLSKKEKDKAVFIDHSFHQITGSTQFLLKLLSQEFNLTLNYDESWRRAKHVDPGIFTHRDRILFFCQVFPQAADLLPLTKGRKIVWFPMYDAAFLGLGEEGLRAYARLPILVICFSQSMYALCRKLGFNCSYYQFFPDPTAIKQIKDYGRKIVYFGQRRYELDWPLVKKLLGNLKIAKTIYVAQPDPGQKLSAFPQEDRKVFNATILKNRLPVNEYHKLVNSATIYIAPRPYEGIGLSFLEALTKGQCVIAPNLPTMSEYITHNKNGLLYDAQNPQPLDLTKFASLGQSARRLIEIGFSKWQNQREKMLNEIVNYCT